MRILMRILTSTKLTWTLILLAGVSVLRSLRVPQHQINHTHDSYETMMWFPHAMYDKAIHPGPVPPPPSDICSTAGNDFRQASGVFAIVTGLENSGTSVLSEFLMSVSHLYGGFECGLLLAKKPRQFRRIQPFFEWMIGHVSTTLHWGLTQEERDHMVQAPCLAEMYRRLRQQSPLFSVPPNEHSWIIDKTPAYIYHLTDVITRAPGVPILISQKDDAQQFASFVKRTTAADARQRMRRAADSLAHARATFPHHPILLVNMTALQANPDAVMTQTLAALGLSWEPG